MRGKRCNEQEESKDDPHEEARIRPLENQEIKVRVFVPGVLSSEKLVFLGAHFDCCKIESLNDDNDHSSS